MSDREIFYIQCQRHLGQAVTIVRRVPARCCNM